MKALRQFALALVAGGFLSLAMVGCSGTQVQQVSAVAQRIPSDPNAALLLATKMADTAVHDLHTARVNGAITAAQEKPYLDQVAKAQGWIKDGVSALAVSQGSPNAESLFAQAISLLAQIAAQMQAQGVK